MNAHECKRECFLVAWTGMSDVLHTCDCEYDEYEPLPTATSILQLAAAKCHPHQMEGIYKTRTRMRPERAGERAQVCRRPPSSSCLCA